MVGEFSSDMDQVSSIYFYRAHKRHRELWFEVITQDYPKEEKFTFKAHGKIILFPMNSFSNDDFQPFSITNRSFTPL